LYFVWPPARIGVCTPGKQVPLEVEKEGEVLRTRLLVLLGLVAFATGCGGKNPVEPSQPGASVSSLIITGADSVLSSTSSSYTVSATLSDGSTRTILPVWTSSDPGVATVNSMGSVDGRSHGSTTLTATYEGRSASKTVRVITNYSGTWEGRYVVRTCADTGDLRDHDGGSCLAGPGRVGAILNITLTLAHSPTNASEIMATFPCCRGAFTGSVTADGGLNLSGSVYLPDFDYPEIALATIQVGQWESTLDGSGRMMGRWSSLYTSLEGRKGTVRSDNELVTMTRN